MGRELRLQLPEEGAAGERHTVLAGYLRREPLQLDVADVAALQAGAGIDIEFLFASGLLDGNKDADAHAFIVERRRARAALMPHAEPGSASSSSVTTNQASSPGRQGRHDGRARGAFQ